MKDSQLLVRRIRSTLPESLLTSLNNKYVWVAPMMAALLGLTIFPFIFLIYLSFHEWSLLIETRRFFIGLDNYRTLLSDGSFHTALFNTGVFVVLGVSVQMILGTAIALYIHFRIPERWQGLIQTSLLFPMMISYVAVALLWRFLWSGSLGLINYFAITFGLPPQDWLGDPTMSIVTIIIADIWQWTPFVILVALAGLQGIPEDILEAAKLDGAKRFSMFRHIIFPMIKPVLLVVLLFRIADSYRVFDKVFLMTDGGPGESSLVLSLIIYRTSFQNGRFGLAAAMSIIMLVIISIVAFILVTRARKMEAL